MRIDKFLKNSRLIKRRSVAKKACDAGRVKINNKTAKAGNEVEIGDIIELEFGDNTLKVQVEEIYENQSKDLAKQMYRVLES